MLVVSAVRDVEICYLNGVVLGHGYDDVERYVLRSGSLGSSGISSTLRESET